MTTARGPVPATTTGPPAATAARTRRSLRLRALRPVTLRRLLAHGLVVRGAAPRRGRLTLRLTGRGHRTLARRVVRLRRAGAWRVRLRIARPARRRVRAGRLTLEVRLGTERARARLLVRR